MAILYSPLTLRGLQIKNHIGMSPMCQYQATDGFASDWHFVHYGSRAVGNVGLIMFEATAVVPEGRISPADLGLWKDSQIILLKKITDFIKSQGASAGIQLAHAGRKASISVPWEGDAPLPVSKGGWSVVAPSAISFSDDFPVPHALSDVEINQIIEAFVSAAHRAISAGFQLIEIHAAHGYLIHEFLSPLSNQRTDLYGGSFANRIRLLIQIVDRIREEIPSEIPLVVRISATDYEEGGWDVAQSILLAKELKKHGVDMMDVSSGGLLPHVKIPMDFGYQIKFAHQIKEEAAIATAAVGMITTPEQAEGILFNEYADFIFLGRELLRNPYFGLLAAPKVHAKVFWPLSYQRAQPSL